jgi:hypothetical protein
VEKEKEPIGTNLTHANGWASSPPLPTFQPIEEPTKARVQAKLECL